MARTKDMCYALTENVGGNTGDIKQDIVHMLHTVHRQQGNSRRSNSA